MNSVIFEPTNFANNEVNLNYLSDVKHKISTTIVRSGRNTALARGRYYCDARDTCKRADLAPPHLLLESRAICCEP